MAPSITLACALLDPRFAPPTPPPPEALRAPSAIGRLVVAGGGAILGAELGVAFAALDDDRPRAQLALGGAGLGAALGLAASWDLSPPAGAGVAALSVAQWGIVGGALAGWAVADTAEEEDDESRRAAQGALFGGAFGGLLGVVALHRTRPTVGTVAAIDALGAGGCTAAVLISRVLDPPSDGAHAVRCLVGAAGGLAIGAWGAPEWEATARRTGWVSLGAAIGASSALLVAPLLADDETDIDERAVAGLALAGLTTGGVYAWYWTIDPDETPGDAAVLAPRPTILAGARGAVPGIAVQGWMW